MNGTKKRSGRRPWIDLSRCSKCGSCIEVAPAIFNFAGNGVYVEIRELGRYDPELVEEAMKYCPECCIHWEDQ